VTFGILECAVGLDSNHHDQLPNPASRVVYLLTRRSMNSQTRFRLLTSPSLLSVHPSVAVAELSVIWVSRDFDLQAPSASTSTLTIGRAHHLVSMSSTLKDALTASKEQTPPDCYRGINRSLKLCLLNLLPKRAVCFQPKPKMTERLAWIAIPRNGLREPTFPVAELLRHGVRRGARPGGRMANLKFASDRQSCCIRSLPSLPCLGEACLMLSQALARRSAIR
jgi:hypothetical protein